MFAAASAVPGVQIVYSEAVAQAEYEVRHVPPLGSYNQWLGRHGMLIRNYCEELSHLAEQYEAAGRARKQKVMSAVSDFLGMQDQLDPYLPSATLGNFAEWVREEAPKIFFGTDARTWQNKADSLIKDPQYLYNPKTRSIGRASQMLYQLRCLFHHDKPRDQEPQWHDAIALLDCLAFLAANLHYAKVPEVQVEVARDDGVVARRQ